MALDGNILDFMDFGKEIMAYCWMMNDDMWLMMKD
jgi:hypothetical protein